jgi:hypothetical protein
MLGAFFEFVFWFLKRRESQVQFSHQFDGLTGTEIIRLVRILVAPSLVSQKVALNKPSLIHASSFFFFLFFFKNRNPMKIMEYIT